MNRLVLLLLVLLGLAAVAGISLSTWVGDDGPVVLEHPSAPPSGPGPRQFYASTSWPGPNTRAGAEIRVLNQGIELVPEADRSLLQATAENGGFVRQNTHATCYLNASATERVCTVQVRRGAKPWAHFRFNVLAATGQVVLHGYGTG